MPSREKMRSPHELNATLSKLMGTTYKSEWHAVTATDVSRFVRATRNAQFIHTMSPHIHERPPYGESIAPAYMTLSLIPHLTRKQIPTGGSNVAFLNYGFNKVRFMEGLPVGAKIRAESTLIGIDERTHGYLLVRKIVIYSDRHEKPIATAESLLFLTTTR